jgi:hypothetical protein
MNLTLKPILCECERKEKDHTATASMNYARVAVNEEDDDEV